MHSESVDSAGLQGLDQGLYQGLYIVATPIGNLGDISHRAIDILGSVDLIAAEDTRHSRKLLSHYDIRTPLVSFHEHSEQARTGKLVERLQAGGSVALISDAGTPLISDPGYRLVRQVREAGIRVTPIPGACAVTTALSAAGLPSDRFTFEGFLPAKAAAREKTLGALLKERRTMVFYEAPHRVLETLTAMGRLFGEDRQAVVARELTKAYETLLDGTLRVLIDRVAEDADQQRGEIVILVHGCPDKDDDLDEETLRILTILSAELPPGQAASLTARISGVPRKVLYGQVVKQSPE